MVDLNQMTQQWPPAPKPKNTARTVILSVAAAGVVLLAVLGYTSSSQPKTPAGHTVVYTVGGTSRGASLITYTVAGSSSEQFANAALPWTKSYRFTGYAVYQVMAQNMADDPGTVTCSIEVDGKIVQTATGNGPATIAHCVSSSLR